MSKPNKAYIEATSWLFEQFPSYQQKGKVAYKPTLENTEKLLDWLGKPDKDLSCVHIAGSNGKGSVCSMLSSTLTEAGYKVGLFTSPHIQDFSERIRINGVPVEQDFVTNFVENVRKHEFNFDPSFFEVTFGMALAYFKAMSCDICVIETGLGGRLDATNVIPSILTAITTISLEHTDILGDTLELIAAEKAGIIKTEVPVVTGKMPSEAFQVIQEKAENCRAPLIETNSIAKRPDWFPLLGSHQLENLATVMSCIQGLKDLNYSINQADLEKGLVRIQHNSGYAGRLQIIEQAPMVIHDVAHNPDGLKRSLEAVREITNGNLHVIFGSSKDKNIDEMMSCFVGEKVHLCQFSNMRSATLIDLESAAESNSINLGEKSENLLELYQEIKSTVNEDDTILITGSFFLLADFF